MNTLLLSLIGIVSGVAIVLLAVVVVFEIDPRAGGLVPGLGWACAAVAGANLAMTAATGRPVTWTTATLAAAFAVLGWRYVALLRVEARARAVRRAEHGQ